MEGPERAQEAYMELFISEIRDDSLSHQDKVQKIQDFFRSNVNVPINVTHLSEKISFPPTTLRRWMQEIRTSVQNQLAWPVSGAAQGMMLQTGIAPPERNSILLHFARQQVPFDEAGSVNNRYFVGGDSSERPDQTRHIAFTGQHTLQSYSSIANAVQVAVFMAPFCVFHILLCY